MLYRSNFSCSPWVSLEKEFVGGLNIISSWDCFFSNGSRVSDL